MASLESMNDLKRALQARNVRFASETFEGIEFLVFDPDQMSHVREIFFHTFGYEMVQGPSLAVVAERMGCEP